jgi:hypothetical protein
LDGFSALASTLAKRSIAAIGTIGFAPCKQSFFCRAVETALVLYCSTKSTAGDASRPAVPRSLREVSRSSPKVPGTYSFVQQAATVAYRYVHTSSLKQHPFFLRSFRHFFAYLIFLTAPSHHHTHHHVGHDHCILLSTILTQKQKLCCRYLQRWFTNSFQSSAKVEIPSLGQGSFHGTLESVLPIRSTVQAGDAIALVKTSTTGGRITKHYSKLKDTISVGDDLCELDD